MDFQLTDEQELLIESAREHIAAISTDEAVKQAYEVDHHISIEAAMRLIAKLAFMDAGSSWRKLVAFQQTSSLRGSFGRKNFTSSLGVTPSLVTDFNTYYDVIDFKYQRTAGNDYGCYRKTSRAPALLVLVPVSEPAAGSWTTTLSDLRNQEAA